ncbi:MAG: class I SAM-dependent methyltransferase, partial [Planctomycetales bacterium]|nr:class I SAM-dependent methyltransferase [Planctomycetales bacterium]
DVGAGTGLYMKALSRSVGESGKVFAVDISPNFVKHLRDRSKTEGLSNVEVVLCSDRNANLPKNSVDRIFICDVYHHFEYPALTMQSLHDALRQDGKLILVDFHRAPKESDEQRRSWLSGHIRAPQETFKQEIIDAGFHFDQEVTIDGFQENYLLQFTKSK